MQYQDVIWLALKAAVKHACSNFRFLTDYLSISLSLCPLASEGESDGASAPAVPSSGGGQEASSVRRLFRLRESAYPAGRTLALLHHQGQQGAAPPGLDTQTLEQVSRLTFIWVICVISKIKYVADWESQTVLLYKPVCVT